MLLGTLVFFKKKIPLIFIILLLTLYLTGFILFTYLEFDVLYRITIYSATNIVIFSYVLYIHFNNTLGYENKLCLSCLFAIAYITINLFRILFLFRNSVPQLFFEYYADSYNVISLGIIGSFMVTGVASLLNKYYIKEIKDSEINLMKLVSNIPTPAILHAKNREILALSKKFTRISGYTLEDIPTIDDWITNAYKGRREEVKDIISRLYSEKDTLIDNEVSIKTKDGSKKIWSFHSGHIGTISDGRDIAMSIALDITNTKEKEEDLKYLAYFDYLTKIHNRRYFEEQVIKMDKEEFYPQSIIMADINGLKLINDAFGHESGDELLILAAQVLKKYIGKNDILARIGGDEFAIVLNNKDEIETEKAIEKINKEASKIKIQSISLSISFGYKIRRSGKEEFSDVFRSAEDSMYREKLLEIPSMRSSAIEAILKTLYEKDVYSEAHSRSVSLISEQLAVAYKIGREKVIEVKTAALLHDIGKIIISKSIISKDGVLTPEEYEVIKTHPEIGFRILNSTSDMREISNIVLNHHERWDGKGYPRGIAGVNIPILSRIISIADALDAMTSERTYRKAVTLDAALIEIIANSGTQFDPELVQVLKENYSEITKNLNPYKL